MPYNAWIIIETHEFRSLVENVFVFVCYSTWSRTCSRSLPLSLISLITRLRGSKSTPNNFQAPINHILLCYLASLVWASVSTKSLKWNSPPPQRKTVECCGWKWTRGWNATFPPNVHHRPSPPNIVLAPHHLLELQQPFARLSIVQVCSFLLESQQNWF